VTHFPAAREGERRLYWFHSDHRAVTRAMLARTLCLQGFAERARFEAEASLEELPGPPSRLSVCRVISLGISRVALFNGDLSTAAQAIARLSDVAKRASAPFWQVEGRFLQGRLLVARGEFAQGAHMLRQTFDTFRQAGWRTSHPEFKTALAEALAGLGHFDEALTTAEEAVASALDDGESQSWYLPELLHIKGRILLQLATDQSAGLAADCLLEAVRIAREQNALLWELGIALSFAHVGKMQRRADEARQMLSSVYGRFTEGFETPSLRAARALLAEFPS
jgi:predicted ATPase